MTHASALPSNPTESSFITATTVGLREEAAAILEARGLSVELIASLGWRSGKRGKNGEEVIEIPFYKDGVEVNCKYRTISGDKKFYQKAGGEKCFYNHAAINEWQNNGGDLLICEGEMDCVVALQLGYLAVSVPDGAPAKRVESSESAKYTYLDGFPKTGTVIICADGDSAGANLLHDLGDRIGKHRCKFIRYPEGAKDLNEVLLKYGEKEVANAIASAEWLKVEGLVGFDDLPPSPEREPMPCEILPLNLRTGEMSVWTGVPGHGKTTLLNHICMVLANQGRKIAVASFEQDPNLEMRYALRTLKIGRPPKQATQEQVLEADEWIRRHFSLILPPHDDDVETDLEWLLEKMVAAVFRKQVSLIIIDPWNELDHSYDKRNMSITDYTGFAVKQLKKFAKRYRVHVAVIAHPAKMKRDRDNNYPIPSLYDIADSAHWSNKPDLGVVVHKVDGKTIVRVAKSRYHKFIGKPGDYELGYDPESQRFAVREDKLFSALGY